MKSAVFDASVFVNSLLLLECHTAADRAIATYVPVMLDFLQIECANVFRTYHKAGYLELKHIERLLSTLTSSFEYLPASPLLPEALRLAVSHDHGIYDCLYVALAQHTDLPLVTADKRLTRKFSSVLSQPIINLYDMPDTLP